MAFFLRWLAFNLEQIVSSLINNTPIRLAISRSTPLWRSSLRIETGLPDLGFVIDYAF